MAKPRKRFPMPPLDQIHRWLRLENGALFWQQLDDPKTPHERRHNLTRADRHAEHYAGKPGYARVRFAGRLYVSHRIIWKMITGQEPPESLYHLDGCTNNNRFENLAPGVTRKPPKPPKPRKQRREPKPKRRPVMTVRRPPRPPRPRRVQPVPQVVVKAVRRHPHPLSIPNGKYRCYVLLPDGGRAYAGRYNTPDQAKALYSAVLAERSHDE